MKSITTKKGDKGYTCIWAKEIVSKDDDLVCLLGQIDELIAHFGIVRLYASFETKVDCVQIQLGLQDVCAEIIGRKIRTENNITAIESYIERLEDQVSIPEDWYIHGRKESSVFLNLARTKTRECERKIVELLNKEKLKNEQLIIFFNRLSDFCFLAMLYEDQNTSKEVNK